jgi:hypothetical protein
MSVLFNKAYCKDIKKIFDLFETIYNDLILKNGILLTELENNPNAQAKYLVQAFAEAEEEVRKIEYNIINNLNKYFAEDILPINSSFLESNSMVKLNGELDNAKLVNALRKYSRVDISPEYSKKEEAVPNDEFLNSLDDTILRVQKQITIISINAFKGVDIQQEANKYLNEINNALGKAVAWLENEHKLQKGTDPYLYLQKKPELEELKKHYSELLENKEKLNDLLDAVQKKAPQGGSSPPPPPPPPPPEPPNTSPKPSFWQKHRYQIIGVAAVALVIVALIVYFTIPPPDIQRQRLVAEGNSLLQNKEFERAIAKFDSAGDKRLVENAERQATQYLKEQAQNASTPQEAINFLKETKKYGYDPTKDIEKLLGPQPTPPPSPPKPTPKKTVDCKDVKILITKNKKGRYSVGDKFTVKAQSSTTNCESGYWKFESAIFANKDQNPTLVEIKKVPSNGKAKLRYYIGNKAVESITVQIIP